MLYALTRWWREQREIRRLMRDFRPHTGRIILAMVACGALILWILIAGTFLTTT